MARMWRLALVWLLVAALPFKAVAGLTMAGCGPAQHARAVIQPVAMAAVDHGDHAGHIDHAGHHADERLAHGGSQDAGAAASEHGPASASAAGAAHAKCSGCAPCCGAAAPAPQSRELVHVDVAPTPAPVPVERYAGVDIDVPHRPPR